MRRLRRFCAVITLCVLLACPAGAGVMPFPVTSPSPASKGEMPTPGPVTAEGQIQMTAGATPSQLLLLLNLLAAAMP